MKKIITSFALCCSSFWGMAQLSITPNQTALDLVNALVATSSTSGVVVSNATLTCNSNYNALFNGTSNFGISDGILLANGVVLSDTANGVFGFDGPPIFTGGSGFMDPGDSLLTVISTYPTYDACVLDFDLQPVGNYVEFSYVFGSDEYPEFICMPYNDIFGFFISGPGFAGPTNIALLPNTNIPVSVNSINDGSSSFGCVADTTLYVENLDTTNTMDGFTVPLTAMATTTPGATYHLKLAIADASDGVINSYVVLRANSLKSGQTGPSGFVTNEMVPTAVYPTIAHQQLKIQSANSNATKADILGLDGKVVLTSQVVNQMIDISVLPSGMYMVRLKNAEGVTMTTDKFVKQ